jgi:uncharacterized protein (TIGR02466 family)
MPLEKSVSYAFPTLIGQFQAPAAEAVGVNAELRRLVLDKERTVPNDAHANAGGWHSPADLLDWPSPAVRTLHGWIVEATDHMIRATLEYMRTTGLAKGFHGSVRLVAWANIARQGNYHRLHNHPGNCWSGVYYVDDGGPPGPADPLSGTLELVDPRPFTEMVYTPGEPFGQRVRLRPRAGALVLFPSFLYHLVNPHHGDGERISIAFNARAVDRDADPPRGS